MLIEEDDYLAHYGILRKSGRYPWGTGANPHQRSKTFLQQIEEHRAAGMSDPEIAKAYSEPPEFPFTTTDLRAMKSIATNIVKQEQIRTAQRLAEKGMGASAIARQMDVNESTVRSLLAPGRQQKLDRLQETAAMLKRQVDEKEIIDIGANVERELPLGDNPNVRIGISHDKFQTAVAMLKEEGYGVHTFKNKQVGTGEMTRYRVLTKPGISQKEAWMRRNEIRLISEKTEDGGLTYKDGAPQFPKSLSSKRVGIRYKEEGGEDADGVIYVRPGKADLDMGKARYAQVRIAVDGTHYLKGMAVYKDDLPDGIDVMFNTNKSNTGNKFDAMKKLKINKETGEVDQDLPFGAVIKDHGQILGKNGKPKSVMNLINEEGDWDTWSRNISPQVLSKQAPELAKSQLAYTYEKRRNEFEEISALTNPLVRRKLLETFAEETDAAAVHMKAAAMPRQATKVLLPANSVKENEIFAPTYRNGERVVLIRYPHAGKFEIPELVVNNKNKEAAKLLGGDRDAPDAVVIHPNVAKHLSGADFDGDSVVVIPNDRGQIQKAHPLDGLKGFDPQHYKVDLGPKTKKFPDGTPIISPTRKQHEMGNITNLIADMTIKGANNDELAQAVRHSMVVIDSEKHNLDFKASAKDNNIAALKRRYQGVGEKGNLKGASTLITRAGSETRIDKVKDRPAAEGGPVDPKTGERKYVPTGEKRPDGTPVKQVVERLAVEKDAYKLVSDHGGTTMEHVYADHSNRLKAMANEVRREALTTELTKYSPSANKTYAKEVAQLNAKLDIALKNAPKERQAQAVANAIVGQKKRANPNMEKDEEKKVKGHALKTARARTGAGKTRVVIEEREWQAIEAGAISNHKLGEILKNSDLDTVRKLATPRTNPVMTDAMSSRAKTLLSSGATLSEVASELGVPMSTLSSSLAEGR